MANIPTENAFSAVYGLYKEGFVFIKNRCEKHQSDIFKINLLALKVICFTGEDAAQAFYDPEKFMRKGAVPSPVQKTLTGVNAIHTKDGEVHHKRKEMFLSLMTDESIGRLSNLVRAELNKALNKWQSKSSIVLFRESSEVLSRAICEWAGVPLKDEEARQRARDFTAMVDAFGNIGRRNLRGRFARQRTEKWIKGVIQDVRNQKLVVNEASALYIAANYRDTNGNLFNLRMAAIELINVLRPTVAISWYITFGATALNNYPQCTQKFLLNQDNYREWFIHELRRFYPFAPFMGAIVKNDFVWKGYHFPKKALVLLDMYGTNHDARLWEKPNEFIPERFKDRKIKPFDFLAQGGGDPQNGHRCPGEWITIEVLKTVLGFLIDQIDFTVPQQDLSFDLSRMPTLPKSGFIMTEISKKADKR